MLLRVMYHDQRYDFIKAARLNEFIEAGTLAMFQRGGGWARVGVDPIRSKKTNSSYNGDERRQSRLV
jgi:hypothetical protein